MLNNTKRLLRESLPELYFGTQKFAGQIATLILRWGGIELPSYFHSSHRIRLVFNRETDPDVCHIARTLLNEGDVVLDVGANVGLVARQFASCVGTTGRVIAFEPDAKTAVFLRRNIRRLPQVEVHDTALSDSNGTAQFFLDPRSGTSNSLAEREVEGEVVTVTCVTLDHFLERFPLPRISLIKIDVEGAESRVLNGMKETLEKHPETCLILEFGPHNQEMASVSPADFLAQIHALGLMTFVITNGGSLVKVNSLNEIVSLLPPEGYVNLLCAKSQNGRVNRMLIHLKS